MWKLNQAARTPEQNESHLPQSPPASSSIHMTQSTVSSTHVLTRGKANIGKSLVIKGDIFGAESLYVEGRIEGAIELSGSHITIGEHGDVSANIKAQEIVVLGRVCGDLIASDRVAIHSKGSLTGDVVARRVSIEDGAFFKGGINIHQTG